MTPAILNAHSHETLHSLSKVKHILESLGSDDLVVFDVDDVLIEQEDALLQSHNSAHIQRLLQQHLAPLDEEAQNTLVSTVYLEAKRRLIEPEVRHIIYTLQQKKVPTIALTATRIGRFGKVTSLQDWRIEDLAQLGITFHQSFARFPHFVLHEIKSNDSPSDPSPIFKSGIIFSDLYSKGKVLKAFLERVSFRPKQVIFFDDRIENVLSVLHEMQQMGIDKVFSFHYLGASRDSIDPLIVEAQITHLLQHGRWLSDDICKVCHSKT